MFSVSGNRHIVEMQLARDKGFVLNFMLPKLTQDSQAITLILRKYSLLLFPIVCSFLQRLSIFPLTIYKTNGHYLKDFQFVFIELPKFEKNRVEQLESTVERWCYFFRYAEETTDEDLRKIAEKSPIIKLAYDELDKFHWNEKDLMAYEERIMDLQKEAAILEYRLDLAKDKGREEGIKIGEEKGIQIGEEKGRKEREIEVAKNLLKAGVSADIISQTTGLPQAEITQLQEEIVYRRFC